MVIGVIIIDVAIVIVSGVAGDAVAAVVEDADQVFRFVDDGIDYRFVTGGSVEHCKGVVAPVLIADVHRLRQSGEVPVFIKRGGSADVDGRKGSALRALGDEQHPARGEAVVQFRDDPGDARHSQHRILDRHVFDGDPPIVVAVFCDLTVEVEVDVLDA